MISGTSDRFRIYSDLNFTTLPTVVLQSASFTVVVTVKDSSGSAATGYTGNISLAIDTNPGSPAGTLSGTTTVAAVAGVATFTGLSIDQLGDGYTLLASDGTSNMVDEISSSIDVVSSFQFTATVGTEAYWLLDQFTVNVPVASLPEVVYSNYAGAIASASAVASAVSAANPSLTNVSVFSTQDWGWSGGEPGTVGDPRAIYINLTSDQGPMTLALRQAIQGPSSSLSAGGKITLSVSGTTYTSGTAVINSQLIYIEGA